jgi:hypothetical protein
MLRTARLTAVAVLPLVLLTACGGGSDSKKASGLSKADYIAKSEALCSKADKDTDALTPASDSPADITKALNDTLSLITKATAELTALADAQSDKAELHKIFIDPLQKQVVAYKAFLPTYVAALTQGADAADNLKEPDVESGDLAAMKTYGFKDCVTIADSDSN